MADLVLDINTEASPAEDWTIEIPNAQDFIVPILTAVLVTVKPIQDRVEVSLLLTDDAHQRALNLNWRGKDKATNVLSFPSGEDAPCENGLALMLGDISLAFETIHCEAFDQHKSFQDHLCHLLVHGMLHLLGFDHEHQTEADEMESLEIDILNGLGLANPYEDRL